MQINLSMYSSITTCHLYLVLRYLPAIKDTFLSEQAARHHSNYTAKKTKANSLDKILNSEHTK